MEKHRCGLHVSRAKRRDAAQKAYYEKLKRTIEVIHEVLPPVFICIEYMAQEMFSNHCPPFDKLAGARLAY